MAGNRKQDSEGVEMLESIPMFVAREYAILT